MSGDDLTSDVIRQQHAAVIPRAESFKPQGVTEQAAHAYLNTEEGAMYYWRVAEAAEPGLQPNQIRDRAIGQLRSGRELPRMQTLEPGEALIKIVPAGAKPTDYSPFWGRPSELDAAVHAGRNLSEYFALPIVSESPRYDAYRITAKVPTQVFVNTVAPTSELDGLVQKSGGAEQSLVPNRRLFTDPVFMRQVDNTLNLAEGVERGGVSPDLVRGAGLLGAVAVTYDASTTATHAADLIHQGNTTGAASEVEHFAGRTAGGFGFAAVGAEIGSFGGPIGTVVGGLLGGGVGAVGGEKLMDAYDRYKIYNQSDAQGMSWRYDPAHPDRGWTRQGPTPDVVDYSVGAGSAFGVMPTLKTRTVQADPSVANVLSFKASTRAAELALDHVSAADPYSLPADPKAGDPSNSVGPWAREADTGVWSHRVLVGRVTERVVASAERTAELERVSQNVIADNAARTPQGIAARYEEAFAHNGWGHFGRLPEAIVNASREPMKELLASDGTRYTRDAKGEWSSEGWLYGTNPATGNIRDELNATAEARSALVERLRVPEPVHAAADPSAPGQEQGRATATAAAGVDPATVTRESSIGTMFDALMTAAANKDVAGMRAVGAAYLSSDAGQSWLQAGRDANQQAQAQMQAQLAAQQAPSQPVPSGPVR